MVDIHTHIGAGRGILSVEPVELEGVPAGEGRLYSVGFHPWNLTGPGPTEEEWERLRRLAEREDVVAIGECGIDLLKGPVLAVQMNVFRRQAEIAEEVGKPVVVHCVKGYEQIIGIRRQMKPEQAWAIHGFRGKPSVAKMLVNAGLWISVGERFNPASLAEIPLDRLLIETDESELPVGEIGARVAEALGMTPEELSVLVDANVTRFLGRDGVVA